MITHYYNRIKHLRIAQPLIKDINNLNALYSNYNRNLAISTISRITLKYESDLQQIGLYLSGRPVIHGDADNLYSDYSKENFLDDIDYLINCLCIIGAVKYGVEKSLENAINKVFS